jgi:hypothetical protein
MEPSEDIYLRELCMLTGKVSKDKSYLYYLLIKDGSYFKKEEPKSEVINDECTVDNFADWFKNI